MRYVFFVNPAAGQGKGIRSLVENIQHTAQEAGVPCKIYQTQGPGDGEREARVLAEAFPEEEMRFYVCGGDGTVNEVINGIIGRPNIAVGVVPIGTGNDLVRNFQEGGDFTCIAAQIAGEDRPMDLIRYEGVIDGRFQIRYCANMFNIGFDCNVVELAGRLKKKPLISGSMAYMMAVFGMFAKKKGIRLRIQRGGKPVREGEMLLCAVANGGYCGGGIHSSAKGQLDDGLFELNIISEPTRREFMKLFPAYKNGTHLEADPEGHIATMEQCSELTLLPYEEKTFVFCVDGEISETEGLELSVAPRALRFIVPRPIAD